MIRTEEVSYELLSDYSMANKMGPLTQMDWPCYEVGASARSGGVVVYDDPWTTVSVDWFRLSDKLSECRYRLMVLFLSVFAVFAIYCRLTGRVVHSSILIFFNARTTIIHTGSALGAPYRIKCIVLDVSQEYKLHVILGT